MSPEKKKVFSTIAYFFSIVFYIIVGILVIIISNQTIGDERLKMTLGILMLLSSVPHFLIYFIHGKLSYFIIGIVGTAFGTMSLASDIFEPEQICMVWGCLDICRGLTEIVSIAPTLKHHKSEIIEILISTGDIVVGVLLCIHLVHGLKLHLTYLAIAFLITAVKYIVEYVFEKRNEAKGSDNH